MAIFRTLYRSPRTQFGIAAIFLILDLILLGIHFELSKSDWAGWVQAVGSMGAIGCALWVFRADKQDRRTQEYSVAQLAAASLLPQISELAGELKSIVLQLERCHRSNLGFEKIKELNDRIPRDQQLTLSELNAIGPLPDNCAFRLAHALAVFNAARIFLQRACQRPHINTDFAMQINVAKDAGNLLREAADQLVEVALLMNRCIPNVSSTQV